MRDRILGFVMLLLVAAVAPQAARAEFGLVPGSFQATVLDAQGQPELRAGATPDRLRTGFEFLSDGQRMDGNVKDVVVDLPTGFAGNPTAVPTCPRSRFSQFGFESNVCPPETQIGVVHLSFLAFGEGDLPIYNVAPPRDAAAEFGFIAVFLPSRFVISVRSEEDFGIRISLRDLPQNVQLLRSEVELWGVPADHQTDTTIARRPFLRNPTRCDQGTPTSTIRVRSWERPDTWIAAGSALPGSLGGCANLPFDPSFEVTPDSAAADSPSGLRLDLALPQADDPSTPATAHLKQTEITLPEGMSLSPGVADGLTACDDGQLRVGSAGPPACPEASKIGSVELQSPALAEPLRGGIFLGRQLPDDRYRLFVTAEGPGFALKLRGSLRADPATGRLTAVLAGLPELPLARLGLRFKGGPRAPLAMPPACGTGTAVARLTSFKGGSPASVTSTVATLSGPGGGPCPAPAPFAPAFVAGSSPARGGADSAFSLDVRRPDGHETVDRMRVTLPEGLTARLARVERCPMPIAQAAGCAAASRVGSVLVEAGAGASPFPLPGDAYLTGPYRGAPFGLALTVRALAGPLDLGTIVVPATLHVDPIDGHLTIATDELPTLVEGVPLRLRTIDVDVNRPGFMVNPTSCRPARIQASIRGGVATTVAASSRYSLAGCRTLRFRPAISVALTDRRALRRGGRPALRIAVRQRALDANLREASVALPRVLALNEAAVNVVCSRERARDGRCSSGSKVGTARVRTPLLDELLTGPVYAVRPRTGETPDLWANVAGGGVRLTLRSSTVARRGQPVRTTFTDLPDLPMSSFSLTLRGGDRGVLTVVKDLCRKQRTRRLQARSALEAQNGKRSSESVRIHARPRCGR